MDIILIIPYNKELANHAGRLELNINKDLSIININQVSILIKPTMLSQCVQKTHY